jgi:NAD(P)-dependent dehydrogenase (short-subunit alcohol dehydrogenase family)
MRLSGRHAVVTGAGSGIGAAIARALSGEGGRVTLVGRDRTALDKVAAGLPSSSVAIADVTDREQVDAAFAEARASAPGRRAWPPYRRRHRHSPCAPPSRRW